MSDPSDPPTRAVDDDDFDDDPSKTLPIPPTIPVRETSDPASSSRRSRSGSDLASDSGVRSTGGKVHSRGWEEGADGAVRGSDREPRSAETPGMERGVVFGGRFEVVETLGKGGMGEVFLVRDRQIEDRLKALKLVRAKWSKNAQFRELFFQEIRSAEKFVSPYVVQIRDSGQLPDGQLFFTMDYVEGESLSRVLRREKMLVPKHALEIARQLLLGLASGHENGLIHRDVKPSNVMLAARTPKTSANPFGVQVGLLDFGLAALTEKLEARRGPGTPHYMSPEQASGQRLDARSDLFAVGVLLFEMISGSRLFGGETEQEVTSSVIETDPSPLIDSLDGIKKPIKRILLRALQKEREKRFSSATEFVEAIEKCDVFREAGGAPGWVGALAGMTSIAAVALGGLYVNELGKSRDVTTAATFGANLDTSALEGQIADLEQNNAGLVGSNEALRTQLNDANENARTAKLTHTSELGLIQNRVDAEASEVSRLTEALSKAKVDMGAIDRTRISAELGSSRVERLLLAELQGLMRIFAVDVDKYGARLAPVAALFDSVVRNIDTGSIPRVSLVEVARADDKFDERTPGCAFLSRLERLAIDIAAFDERGSSGTMSFSRLSDLGDRWEATCSDASLMQFRSDAEGDPMQAGRDGRWLGLRRLSDVELGDRLHELVAEDRGRRFDEASSALGDTGGLTEDEVADAIVSKDVIVKQKRDLAEWFKTNDSEGASEVLFAAQVTTSLADERMAALRSACQALKQRLDEHRVALDAAAIERTAQVRADGPLVDHAEDVLGFLTEFGTYGKAQATPLVSALVARAQAEAVEGGMLVADGITALPRDLGVLAELVLAGGRDNPYEVADEQALDDLRWLWTAYRWYVDPSLEGRDWQTAFEDAALRQPTETIGTPWRAQLAFQFQVASELRAIPANTTSQLVFHTQEKVGGASGWWVYAVDKDDSGRDALFLEMIRTNGTRESRSERRLDESPKLSGTLSFEGRALLDVRSLALENATFEYWTPPSSEVRKAFVDLKAKAVQSMREVDSPERIVSTAYGSSWSPDDGYRCLVVESQGYKYWVHPILGVVRQELALLSADLVHLDVRN